MFFSLVVDTTTNVDGKTEFLSSSEFDRPSAPVFADDVASDSLQPRASRAAAGIPETPACVPAAGDSLGKKLVGHAPTDLPLQPEGEI